MSHHDAPSQTPSSRSQLLIASGVLLVVVLVILASAALSRSVSPTETEDAERAAVRMKNLAELQAADTVLLTTYGWNDQAKGVVHIPIARAMELVIPSLAAKSSQATTQQKQP